MQIILTTNVPKVGKKNDVVKVSSGFALNYLLPQGLAKRATKGRIESVQKRVAEATIRRDEVQTNAESIAKKLTGKTFEMSRKASDKGHLYAGIHEQDVIDIIVEKEKVELAPDQIILGTTIKETGDFAITLKLTEEISAAVTLKITAL